ncbi:MAG: antitoxin [Solirubrobacteraceae bacterium]
MRTTVTLDDDLFAKLRGDAHERGVPFKTAVNEAIRAGLQPASAADIEPYRITPEHLGATPAANLDKALQYAFDLEDEATLEKMRLGR